MPVEASKKRGMQLARRDDVQRAADDMVELRRKFALDVLESQPGKRRRSLGRQGGRGVPGIEQIFCKIRYLRYNSNVPAAVPAIRRAPVGAFESAPSIVNLEVSLPGP